MNELHEEDVLTDIRSRMIDALLMAENVVRDNEWLKLLQSANIEMVDVMGSRIFSVLYKNEENFLQWQLKPNDYTRLEQFGKNYRSTGNCMLLKLEYPQKGVIGKNLRLEESQIAYDCLSLYKHPDKSQEWRKCRVVRRKQKESIQAVKDAPFDSQCYDYWIEF